LIFDGIFIGAQSLLDRVNITRSAKIQSALEV
jgi:hypothetical protein